DFSDTLALDLATVEPSLAGPRRPQDRVPLREVKKNFLDALPTLMKATSPVAPPATPNARRWEEEGGNVAVATEAPPARRSHVNLTLDGAEHKLRHGSVVIAVLSGNRNFEGRIQSEVRANYLASPPLVVAYALAGRIDIDIHKDPIGTGKDGKPVYLRDIWPTAQEVDRVVRSAIKSAMFHKQYGEVFEGDERWK